ncbi:HXXXD-type acyl-transferase family protein [Prunus dulcis]|uniref:HXXXD-type acyl-transferase family protein n=1 Tax=Prunus dulcis TaxID=3755 RepID=A0A4Y1QTQ3_PRUDU|nr:HXXXD-type acyl-transferase family protein [Prunus dulcis]
MSVCVSTKLHDALSKPKWVDAMHVGMEALNKNATWELQNADGSIDRYKARLVVKSDTQTYGVDYTETFALVAKLNTVCVLLSLAANHDWPMLQFDVKNAFLHGDLKKEIYMDPPPSIPVTSKEGMVCKLRKCLYGLKQSPRAWFRRFAASMRKSWYVQSNSNHTLFLKGHKGKLTASIIYVDDIIVTGDDQAEIQSLQKYLASEFEMKSLGDLKYFLGIEVARSKHDVEGYTDADWASSATDRHSTSGYFTFVGGNLVTWRSKKQNVVARSSAEAEYRWMAHVVCELLWLRRLLRDLGFGPKKPMDLYCDNKAAIEIAHSPVQHDRTKHVQFDAEIVSFPFISYEYQLAHVLTKAVSTNIT